MNEQLDIFGGSEFVAAPSTEKWDPVTDMAFQPQNCNVAGCDGKYYRNGAYLQCPKKRDHWRMVDCVGREDHPHFEAFARYRRQIGHPID
ncbi:MAG: hypothetical protein V4587_00205 [Acidobacteriota bacterium]